ncbi:hypothetical protein [Volucribacter psittacicida]|uniref:hypothetical protein n=1 Tax=Volucribacter psittacicida TaxID=203482 RepID=UPI001A9EA02A|nr:hypothetical protein [Volucribacter psittacicida]
MEQTLVRNARIREEGTANLVAATEQAGVQAFIAQSIAFVYEPSKQILTKQSPLLNFADPVYGKDTGFEQPFANMPSVNVDAAVNAAFLAVKQTQSAIFNITDDSAMISNQKAKTELAWSPDFRF